MMLRRRSMRGIALAALAAMLFMQAAFAVAACQDYRTQARAVMVASQQAGGSPCHEADPNAGLCMAHCQGMDQTLDKHQVKAPLVAAALLPAPRSLQAAILPSAPLARVPCLIAGPPARILFQSFLT